MEKTERLCKVASPFQVVKPLVSTNRFRLLRPDDDRDARTSRTEEQLRATARQQEAVAHLGQQALAGTPVADLEQAAVAVVARILDVEFASVLEFRPESRTLLLRAGVGWSEGSVGRAVVPADADSHAGYVLRSSGAVVVEDLASDTRFGSAPLLAQHGVASSLSVVVHGKERPFGVLGVHTARRREFTIHDTHFLQAVANVLATTVDRARTEAALRQSEEHFRSLIENASDIVTIVGENGVFRYASPSVERVLGYKPGDLLERNAFDFVHPDDIPAVAEALSRAIHRPGSPQAAQLRFRANDGAWRPLGPARRAAGLRAVRRRAAGGGGREPRARRGHVLLDGRGLRGGVRHLVHPDPGGERRGVGRDRGGERHHRAPPLRGGVAAVGGEQPRPRAARDLWDLPLHPRRAAARGQSGARPDAGLRLGGAAAGREPGA